MGSHDRLTDMEDCLPSMKAKRLRTGLGLQSHQLASFAQTVEGGRPLILDSSDRPVVLETCKSKLQTFFSGYVLFQFQQCFFPP